MRFLDPFAGAGGLADGLRRAGLAAALLSDQEPACCQTLRRFGDAAHPTPLRAQHAGPEWRRRHAEPPDLLAAGPPCQPYSPQGRGAGAADPRDGLPVLLQLAAELRPAAVLIENTSGLGTHHRATLRAFGSQLAQLGYAAPSRPYAELDAAAFGVPQFRRRLFGVWFLDPNAARCFAWPVGPYGSQVPYRSARQVLPDLAELEDSVGPLRLRARSRRWGAGEPLDRPAPTVLARRSSALTAWREDPDQTGWIDPSGQHRTGRGIPVRRLTVDELLVLQDLAGLQLCGTVEETYRQAGNACPPGLLEPIGRSLLAASRHETVELAAEPTDSRTSLLLRLPRSLRDRLRERAEQTGQTVTDLIVQACRDVVA